jgi:hypothetical protein
MDGLREALEVLQSEAASYSLGVRIWMRVMAISFFAGIVFTPWKSGARWVVSVMVVTAAGLIAGKVLFPDFSREAIGTVLHLSLWPIPLILLWRPAARRERRGTAEGWFGGLYQAWVIWVSTLIVTSLVFDARFLLLILLESTPDAIG